MVDGHDLSRNQTCRNTDGWPKPGVPGTLTIQVRRGGLKTWHDGRLVLEFPTDYSNVQAHQQWELGGKGIIGLGVMGAVGFHRLEILEVSGRGTFARPGDPAAKEAERKRSASAAATDPKGPATGSVWVIRGGNGSDLCWGIRSARRFDRPPDTSLSGRGFQVVVEAGP
jgi:hypothetical protein